MGHPVEARVATGRNYLYFYQNSENEGPYAKFYLQDEEATFDYGCLVGGNDLPEYRFTIKIPADVLKAFYKQARESGVSVLEGEGQAWMLAVRFEEMSETNHRRRFKHFVCELNQRINPNATEVITFTQPLFMVGGALGILD